jgi:hypothetical protein
MEQRERLKSLPGTASSRSRTFSNFGETYCSSRAGSACSCFVSFLKTCHIEKNQSEVSSSYAIVNAEPATNHVVIVPSLTQLVGISRLSITPAVVPSDGQVVTEALDEGLLSKRFSSL